MPGLSRPPPPCSRIPPDRLFLVAPGQFRVGKAQQMGPPLPLLQLRGRHGGGGDEVGRQPFYHVQQALLVNVILLSPPGVIQVVYVVPSFLLRVLPILRPDYRDEMKITTTTTTGSVNNMQERGTKDPRGDGV